MQTKAKCRRPKNYKETLQESHVNEKSNSEHVVINDNSLHEKKPSLKQHSESNYIGKSLSNAAFV